MKYLGQYETENGYSFRFEGNTAALFAVDENSNEIALTYLIRQELSLSENIQAAKTLLEELEA